MTGSHELYRDAADDGHITPAKEFEAFFYNGSNGVFFRFALGGIL